MPTIYKHIRSNQKSISFELYAAIELKKLHALENLYLLSEQDEKTNNDNLKIFFAMQTRIFHFNVIPFANQAQPNEWNVKFCFKLFDRSN